MGGGWWRGGGPGESLDGHTSLNYSWFAKPKLNPTLPLSLSSVRLLSLSLFWLIHCRGSESYWSNSGLIPRKRDGPVEGWILSSFESGHVLCQKITWNALCPALGQNIERKNVQKYKLSPSTSLRLSVLLCSSSLQQKLWSVFWISCSYGGQSGTGFKPYQLLPPVMSSPGGRSPERRQHVMLFLASCSEGFVRKLGEILSMAVSMWGAGYNRDSFSRRTQTRQIWVI